MNWILTFWGCLALLLASTIVVHPVESQEGRPRSTILGGQNSASPPPRTSERVGVGTGGALEGTLFSPIGPDNTRMYVVACPVSGAGCNRNAAAVTDLPGGLFVGFRFENLPPGPFIVMAWRDVDADGRQGPRDFAGVFSMNGREPTPVHPPARGVNVRMKDPQNPRSASAPGGLQQLAGSWREVQRSSYQAATASLRVFQDGRYERSAMGSFRLGDCGGEIARTEQGALVVSSGRLRFDQRSAQLSSGGSCLPTQRGSASAAPNPEFYYEITIDELGRLALFLRQANEKDVIELEFIQ